eukprot:GHVU01152740.1.p1 GENE.GHVU01152740.1~~GHVU01152740.1.p1  ORF type:complete len:137 (+),score=22.04 GHVU01152740.1:755-1165(+)
MAACQAVHLDGRNHKLECDKANVGRQMHELGQQNRFLNAQLKGKDGGARSSAGLSLSSTNAKVASKVAPSSSAPHIVSKSQSRTGTSRSSIKPAQTDDEGAEGKECNCNSAHEIEVLRTDNRNLSAALKKEKKMVK